MERSQQLQSPTLISAAPLATQGLDSSLPDLAQGTPPVLEVGVLIRAQEALTRLPAGVSAMARFEAARNLQHLIADYQMEQTVPAIREVLADLRERFIPELVGVRFKAFTWDNDDATTSDRAEVEYGVAMCDVDDPSIEWTEWMKDSDLVQEYPALANLREFLLIDDTLEELSLWNLDDTTETFEVLLEESPEDTPSTTV